MTFFFFPTDSVAEINGRFGVGRLPIFLSRLDCNGRENNLFECPGNGPGAFCFTRDAAGAICSGMFVCCLHVTCPLNLLAITSYEK